MCAVQTLDIFTGLFQGLKARAQKIPILGTISSKVWKTGPSALIRVHSCDSWAFLKLRQEPHVVFVEVADVFDAVHDHGK
ncbi:MAG TPA: hypothetical protein VJ904_06635, partial [Tichowtungia sp.]|nr:hypothetical protein [Tichowtungia sp.]